MANPLDLLSFAKRAWDQTQQPLKERATVLPFGQYQDGSVGLAWPGIVAAPFEGMTNFGRYGYDTPEAIRDNALSAFDVAGGAVTGGLGVGLAGGVADNALGSAGAKAAGAAPRNNLERSQPQGIRAYHGSPHDFDRFSLDKIGTGEGAQAYGHGLYFADSEGVARSYRDALSKRQFPEFQLSENVPDRIRQALADIQSDPDMAATSNAQLQKRQFNLTSAEDDALLTDLINSGDVALKDTPGRMYEVNIKANPEDFLDWDKPLPAQPDFIQSTLDPLVRVPFSGSAGDLMRNTVDINQLVDLRSPSVVSQLREAGIPGIRYLDGNSRGAGDGSSNYVVFDDQLIDILRKYANAPTGAAVPLASETQDQDPALLDYLRAIGLY